jgi:hypothetical protein
MTTTTLERPPIAGPVHVEIGSRVVNSKLDMYPYPRQSFPINRQLLSENGYGDAAISSLERGLWIVGGGGNECGPGEGLIEFPDGARYVRTLEHLGGEKMRVTIVRRLADAIR